MHLLRTCLVVQWLRLRAPSAGDWNSIPGWGTRSHMPQLSSNLLLLLVTKSCLTLCYPMDYWKNHNFNYMNLRWQSVVSAF